MDNFFCQMQGMDNLNDMNNMNDMDMDNMMPQHMVLAMAYVLMQQLNEVYETDKGSTRGTIFPELDKPFLAGGCSCE